MLGDIIRCNDCKNYMVEWSPYDEEHYCKVMRRNMKPGDWCNYADDENVGSEYICGATMIRCSDCTYSCEHKIKA